MTEQGGGRAEQQILDQIGAMVADERTLREQAADGTIDGETERRRLRELERALDQCWDLLRQRRARADAGDDPGWARVRPADQVEGYES
ncbi:MULTISPECIES: DUF2630 family protein [Streptomycetaceae]|uniref:DUF2630 family protein n=1 Tax=Streptantibioticus cattleyicolor (strain ATCC 35852 / DSM 46488 / JCM 4925 / NBRC 14057 / NRRL 8057) TaxID=1003195 RepID=F8K0M5_STREN|nr:MULTISPECIES: DUF2630 family protein [Streptomycetaceae]AEW94528.1 hypothetical protein SCATT_21570 [Streptantibioticus cattleyicolor NRRL 8057 = DSM 46488]MYS59169.1 DUF2630 family protein [Streptomyces sp. SID5468]CCB74886.1 conserved protein of unknown function [Streptantibioticus cattleyicolor NRRL 8057 = DSM 46488]